LGVGSTFWFELVLPVACARSLPGTNAGGHSTILSPPVPLPIAEGLPTGSLDQGQVPASHASSSYVGPEDTSGTKNSPITSPTSAQFNARILIADDNRTNQLLVQRVLAKAGFKDVVIVGDGRAALDAITARDFDVVLLDIMMPILDGYSAAHAIRALPDEKKATVPIIALSASALKADVDNALAAGMNDHIAKPCDSNTLVRGILKWLPQHLR
jgi:CheY-like chemotaxis protein